jgi:hypothetical protein
MSFSDNAQCNVTLVKYYGECSSEFDAMTNTATQIPKEITNCRKNVSCTTEQTSALFEMVCPTLKKLGDCLKPAISCIKQSMAEQSLASITGLFNDCDTFISGSRTFTATATSDEGIATATSDEGIATATEPSDKTTAAIKPKQTSIGHYIEKDFPDETEDDFVDSATSVQGSVFFLLAIALL